MSVADLTLMAVMVRIMPGAIPVDRGHYGGLLQRFLAFASFVPLAVAGPALRREPSPTGLGRPARPYVIAQCNRRPSHRTRR
ncbi:hypothetical protein [Nannocystis pusilla]|uniref:hypothetical protein n=1 Tax=Nannocystis pusilla TaxID=889268 RepID=UPI003BF1392A